MSKNKTNLTGDIRFHAYANGDVAVNLEEKRIKFLSNYANGYIEFGSVPELLDMLYKYDTAGEIKLTRFIESHLSLARFRQQKTSGHIANLFEMKRRLWDACENDEDIKEEIKHYDSALLDLIDYDKGDDKEDK